MNTGDKDPVEKITKILNIKILPRELKSKDGKLVLRTIMKQWLPLASCLLLCAVQVLPSPIVAQKYRLDAFMRGKAVTPQVSNVIESMKQCSSDNHTIG